MHLLSVERYLQPNVDYILKALWQERMKRPCFIGKTGNPPWLTMTEEANKEPLKLVYNSDRSLSFFVPSIGKWLRALVLVYLDQQYFEGASKFEPLRPK